MAERFWGKVWQVLQTDIPLPDWVSGTAEVTEKVLGLAGVLDESQDAPELKFLFDGIGGLPLLLEVLNSPLGKVAGATLPFVPLVTGLMTYVVEKQKQVLTLPESVLLVAQAAYLESARDFFRDNPELKLQEKPASKQLDNKVALDEGEAEEVLLCFHESKLAEPFNSVLQARLQESGLAEGAARVVTERISRGTFRYLKKAANAVRDKVPDLHGLFGEGYQRDLELYASLDDYLERIIAKRPKEKVFDEAFGFEEIYVPSQVRPVRENRTPDEDTDTPRQNIEDWAERLLAEDKAKVLFVQAGPGRGKSVFCRMLADKVRRELHPIWTPILIRLRDIEELGPTLEKTLELVLRGTFVGGKWLTERNTRFLFFLDGFDELLLSRDATGELKQLLEQVANFQREYDGQRKGMHHRIILTGRPFALYGIDKQMPGNFERVGIVPIDPDSQTKWLENWDAIHKRELAKGFQEFLERCPQEVQALAGEPLLLYLLAAMHRDGELTIEMFAELEGETQKVRNPKVAAKVLVYQRAIDWVLKRQPEDPVRGNIGEKRTNLDVDDLREVLQETGLCAVQSGREYARLKMVESRLDAAIVKALQAEYEDSEQKSCLKSAMTAFYMRAKGEGAVEFVHKSFGEFLCAERLVAGMVAWTEKSKKKRQKYALSDDDVYWQVYDLLGYGHLSWEILDYVLELLQEEEQQQEGFLAELGERLQNYYGRWSGGEFIEDVEEMLPRRKAMQLQKQEIFKGQRAVDVYAGYNALKVLFALHRRGIPFQPCGDPEAEDFAKNKTLLLRLIGYGACLGAFTFTEELGRHLIEAYLRRADLRGAYLGGAYLIKANLIEANLSGADLRGANLRGANLSGADLRGANLRGANLRGANLRGANLRGADLIEANLIKANLRGADLRGANLRGADLRGANLSGADLIKADLRGADLRGAQYSEGTRFPEGFDVAAAGMICVEV